MEGDAFQSNDDPPLFKHSEDDDTSRKDTMQSNNGDSLSPPIEHPSGNVVLEDERRSFSDNSNEYTETKDYETADAPSAPKHEDASPSCDGVRATPDHLAVKRLVSTRNIDSESECSDVVDTTDYVVSDDQFAQPVTLHIKELDLDLIRPSFKDKFDPSATGSKIVVIGKPGTGKTTLISDILYRKRFIIPVGQVYSGTEDSNGFYQQLFPSLFVFNRYNEDAVKDFIRRQKTAKSEGVTVPWGLLLLDDCTDNTRILTSQLFQNIFKNGRHWKMLFILSLQYCMDIKPVIRTNVDGVFILRESNLRNRKSLYENYGSCIPSFSMFQMIMDDLTSDYSALYIHNRTTSNNIEDCVFYYKATQHGDFEFGSPDFRKYHEENYNTEYKDPVIV